MAFTCFRKRRRISAAKTREEIHAAFHGGKMRNPVDFHKYSGFFRFTLIFCVYLRFSLFFSFYHTGLSITTKRPPIARQSFALVFLFWLPPVVSAISLALSTRHFPLVTLPERTPLTSVGVLSVYPCLDEIDEVINRFHAPPSWKAPPSSSTTY